jgi:hypothetical protein
MRCGAARGSARPPRVAHRLTALGRSGARRPRSAIGRDRPKQQEHTTTADAPELNAARLGRARTLHRRARAPHFGAAATAVGLAAITRAHMANAGLALGGHSPASGQHRIAGGPDPFRGLAKSTRSDCRAPASGRLARGARAGGPTDRRGLPTARCGLRRTDRPPRASARAQQTAEFRIPTALATCSSDCALYPAGGPWPLLPHHRSSAALQPRYGL